MIIKKKYTSIKKAEEMPSDDAVSFINDAVRAYEEMQREEFEEEENLPPEELTQEEIRKQQDIDDLDLSLENIQFEQREERREGTRRRGYRRSRDRNIITRAQQEAISIKEASKNEGYEEGLKNAKEDLEEIKNRLTEFFDCKQEVFEKVSGCIMDIAVQIAKKILEKEIKADKEYIIPLIKSLIDDIDKTESKITLKVIPKDAEIVKDNIDDIFPSKYFEAKISVIPDNSVKDGGVIIETSNGIIDASIETRLAIMEQILKKKEETE